MLRNFTRCAQYSQPDPFTTPQVYLFDLLNNFVVFDSSFVEGYSDTTAENEDSIASSEETSDKSSLPLQRRITVDDDFDLFHSILYYIYTNRITFSTNLSYSTHSRLPKLCATEDIYQIADRLFLSELKAKALNFLANTCSVQNITSRMLSEFTFLHEDVQDRYVDYFLKNWKVIRATEDLRRLFTDGFGDSYESTRLIELFPELSLAAVGEEHLSGGS